MRGHRVHGRICPVSPPPLGKILDSWGLCTTTRFGVCAKATNGQNNDSAWEYNKGKKLKETMAQDSTDFHYIKGRLKDQFCLL